MTTTTLTAIDAREELAKFLKLAVELNEPLTMFSDFVDHEWHDLVDRPDEYREFCVAACGKELGHVPAPKDSAIVRIGWIAEYEARHGDLPPAWFATEDGEILPDAYQDYLDTHEVVASWNCTPSTSSSGDSD